MLNQKVEPLQVDPPNEGDLRILNAEPRVHPILFVPYEILGVIFENGYIYSRDGDHRGRAVISNRSRRLPPFEVLVSHVCQLWRNVAISLPELWSSVKFFTNPSPSHSAMTRCYLQRSLSFPLVIECDMRAKRCDQVLDDSFGVWERVLGYAKRWRRLTVKCSSEEEVRACLGGLEELHASVLEKFELKAPPYVATDALFAPRSIFKGGAPSLKHVRLGGFNLLHCMPHLETITQLELCTRGPSGRMHYEQFISTFQRLHGLLHLSLGGGTVHEWPTPDSITALEMPQLLTLQLSDPGWVLSRYLLTISAPTLQSLTLHDVMDSDFCYDENSICLRYPSLQELILVNPHPRFSFLTAALEFFPTVTRLSILQADPESLSILLDTHESLAWSKLQTITLAPPPDRIEALFNLVSARIAAGHPLTRLTLPTPDEFEGVEQLRDYVDIQTYPGESLEPYHVHILDIPDL